MKVNHYTDGKTLLSVLLILKFIGSSISQARLDQSFPGFKSITDGFVCNTSFRQPVDAR